MKKIQRSHKQKPGQRHFQGTGSRPALWKAISPQPLGFTQIYQLIPKDHKMRSYDMFTFIVQ